MTGVRQEPETRPAPSHEEQVTINSVEGSHDILLLQRKQLLSLTFYQIHFHPPFVKRESLFYFSSCIFFFLYISETGQND